MSNKSQTIDDAVDTICLPSRKTFSFDEAAAATMPSVSPLLQFQPEEVPVQIPVLPD